MKRHKILKIIVFFAIILLFATCIFTGYKVISRHSGGMERFVQAGPRSEQSDIAQNEEPNAAEGDTETYRSPVDFSTLQKINPDFYGWLDIPGTDITYPLLQRNADSSYYLSHDAEGKESANGALYTEAAYNSTSFDDPITVIYGKCLESGLLFGQLQEIYSDPGSFAAYQEVVVYLPENELHFEVFAAVPYEDVHILSNYDFTDKRIFRLFFKDILSVRSLVACFAEEVTVQSGDQVLVLSTSLIGNSAERYLVFAKLLEED